MCGEGQDLANQLERGSKSSKTVDHKYSEQVFAVEGGIIIAILLLMLYVFSAGVSVNKERVSWP